MATINISTNDAKVIETTEEAAFAHVMKEILFKPAFDMDFGIWGVKTVWELLSLSKEDLDEYNFHDEGSKVAKLRLMEWKKIHNIHGWYFTLETPNLDSWFGLTVELCNNSRNPCKIEYLLDCFGWIGKRLRGFWVGSRATCSATPAKTLDLACNGVRQGH